MALGLRMSSTGDVVGHEHATRWVSTVLYDTQAKPAVIQLVFIQSKLLLDGHYSIAQL